MPFVSKNTGWKRITAYYKPWYGNIGIGLLSIVNTFSFIMYGVFVVLIMVLFTAYEAGKNGVESDFNANSISWKPDSDDGTLTKADFILYKRILLISWAIWLVISWLVTASEKSIFVVMGEGLTY